MTAARQLAQILFGCALVLGGAYAAEVGPSASQLRPQTVQAGALGAGAVGRRTARPVLAVVHPVPVRRTDAGSAATIAAAARPSRQPLAMQPPAMRSVASRSNAALTAMARTAVVGGPRSQARASLGGPQISSSAARGGITQGVNIQGGISGTALRRRY